MFFLFLFMSPWPDSRHIRGQTAVTFVLSLGSLFVGFLGINEISLLTEKKHTLFTRHPACRAFHHLREPNPLDFGLPISIAVSDDDGDVVLGSRLTDSNMAAVSALARI